MNTNFNRLFTKLENWQLKQFNPTAGVIDVSKSACVINFKSIPQTTDVNLEEFYTLLQASQAEELQALVCQIHHGQAHDTAFGVVLEALCDACENLPNLKAIFIGDEEQHEYRKSKLKVFDIRPILEAYPNLQVLQVRGDFDCYSLECEFLRHEHLKTLVIETAGLNNYSFDQICTLKLPALEYFELWLGGKFNVGHIGFRVDTLNPVLLCDSFPNLSYLGLRSSDNSDRIVKELVQSPILERLTALDLSMGNLSDEGAKNLLNCPAINKLYCLNVANNCISEEMIQRFSQLNCQIIVDNQEIVYNKGCGRSRYLALHE